MPPSIAKAVERQGMERLLRGSRPIRRRAQSVATGSQRKRKRFPAYFMLRLNASEWAALRSQSVTSNPQRGGRRYRPYAFTEQGVAMLSTVLKSHRAITVNIRIMRAFVQLREMLASNKELARRFAQLEIRLDKKLTIHDEAIAAILPAIRQLVHPPVR